MADSSYPKDHGRSFLEGLPLSTKRYRYQGKEHFLHTYYLELDRFTRSKSGTSEYIIFDIDAETLEKDFLDPDIEDRSFTFDSFDTDKNLLLIKMESDEHAEATRQIGFSITEKLHHMGLRTAVKSFPSIRAGVQGKHPDDGWGPVRPPPGHDRRATVVIEVGLSESQQKLERDATFLLDPQRGKANIALTVKLNRRKPQITIDKYECDGDNGCINRVQHIQITETSSGDDVTVSNPPLVIPFEQLMMRPKSSPAENDIIIGAEELKDIADIIWNGTSLLQLQLLTSPSPSLNYPRHFAFTLPTSTSNHTTIVTTVFINGRILCGSSGGFVCTLVIEDGHISHVGWENDDAVIQVEAIASIVDLKNRMVLPGFNDGHVHILNFSMSLQKLNLLPCKTLADIRDAITSYAATHPLDPRILCRGWVQSVTDGKALATVLDDLDPRPIYVEALDLHSTWCNNSALREFEAHSKFDPPGGKIHHYSDGIPSGLLEEAAQFDIVWPFLGRVTSMEKKLAAIDAAISAHRRAGYTGVVDMAMGESGWVALNAYRTQRGELPMHVAVHWLVPYSKCDADICSQIDRAIALQRNFNRKISPEFCINGIKLICDGTVDGCTAGLHQPYGGLSNIVDPIWPANALAAAIRLQLAIDCLSQIEDLPACRHRIEHLEITTPEDAKRLGQLGIVASVQPVHLDPATFVPWPEKLGIRRCKRGFAYQEFVDVTFETDAPTAEHHALPNLYVATTRRSSIDPSSQDTVNPEFRVSLATAAAYGSFSDSWTGSLRPGYKANFVVLDLDMVWAIESLLEARVCQTWYKGKKVFDEKGSL
ncbi:Amidohydrolase 3 [Penicillium cf. griseofulvum]|nr:Amidohydrolase 3 [Penicillium cf. griseofulvum]